MIKSDAGYEDALAFRNPDNSIIIIAGNQTSADRTLSIAIGNRLYRPTLKAGSVSTVLIK